MLTTLIPALKLKALIYDQNLLILDCRFNLNETEAGYHDWQRGHIPGAHYLHLDRNLSSPIRPDSGRHPLPDPQTFADQLITLGLKRHTQVIVYDASGGAIAARAWWLLRWLGHKAVAVLDGGWPAWQAVEGAIETQAPPQPTPGHFIPKPQHNAYIETTQLVQPNNLQLVDARAPERFNGADEPLDSVAGHIPGALNRPLTDNLEAGYFKNPLDLRQEWQALLGDTLANSVVHMCGSGVTACHNLLSMDIAGLHGSRLYAGSWSEWIRDPQRPISSAQDTNSTAGK